MSFDGYEEAVRYLEANIKTLPSCADQVIFYGSSSIRLWPNLQNCFSWDIINLGFGGSTIAACAWFMPRLLFRFKPKGLVIHAGDNDLAAGRYPEEICNNFRLMMFDIRRNLGPMPVFFISIKPSPSRFYLRLEIERTNRMAHQFIENEQNLYYIDVYSHMVDEEGRPLEELYVEDLLHLSQKGYNIWAKVIGSELERYLC